MQAQVVVTRSKSSSRKLGSRNQLRKRKYFGNIIHTFFLALILIAVALSALAVHLTTHITSTKTITRTVPAPESKKITASSSTSTSHKSNINIVSHTTNINSANKLPYPNGPKNDTKYVRDRVYCMVPFIWNNEMYDAIMQTWGKRCNTINFLTDAEVMTEGKFQGHYIINDQNNADDPTKGYKHYSEFPEGTFPDNVIFVNMTRPWTGCRNKKDGKPQICRHIWEKMWQSWIHVGDHHLNDAEWFCKVDYDTFFFPENLQYYVRDYKQWDASSEHHYFGLVLGHERNRPEMIAGAAACWSQKTLAAIVDVYKKMPKGFQKRDRGRCEDRPMASEEISTSLCLKKELNVSAEPMLDEQMRQYVMNSPYKDHLTWNRTEQGEWWYWQGKPANVGQMDDCCSHRPMGTHNYKRRAQIEALNEQFYGKANNKELAKLNERTRRYANKVRAAMGFDE